MAGLEFKDYRPYAYDVTKEKVRPPLEKDGGKARIIASYTNKCRQLIRQPIVYARKSTTRGAKSTPFVLVYFFVCTQNDVSVMSMHKVYKCRQLICQPIVYAAFLKTSSTRGR
ncbi:hypothetical protein HOLleu_06026 [Holothuria leucospilota]|uniref:Uncharacterized protein n=1 Tax=Holothuria leucospilota TaxID=206669 RepID=A0A9Q1CLY8_HOLLE|nr:hypothetical protein HOLleu_06026 [Holothuria leucospilota]